MNVKPISTLVSVGKGKVHHLAKGTDGPGWNDPLSVTTMCGKTWTGKFMGTDLDSRCKICAKIWAEMGRVFIAEQQKAAEIAEIENLLEPVAASGFSSESVDPLLDTLRTFNGREYKITGISFDQVAGGGSDTDWLTLTATDGSGTVKIQRRDLWEAPEAAPAIMIKPLTLSQFLNAGKTTPALPRPRQPFTPLDMDALNLGRRLGSPVRVKGDSGTGRVARVLPRLGDNPPAVVVRWSDGHTSRYALSDVMLAG